MFSVDGGHTAHLTANDLEIAADALVDGGIVVLDDYWPPNRGWAGVTEGLYRFLGQQMLVPGRRCQRLIPFLAVDNKIWLTTPSHHAKYLKFTRDDPVFKESNNTLVLMSTDVEIVDQFGFAWSWQHRLVTEEVRNDPLVRGTWARYIESQN
jgi:hypothetical protein